MSTTQETLTAHIPTATADVLLDLAEHADHRCGDCNAVLGRGGRCRYCDDLDLAAAKARGMMRRAAAHPTDPALDTDAEHYDRFNTRED